MFRLENIIRKNILDLVPYSSARDEYSSGDALYYDANENPYNRPYNRYPDPHQVVLRKKISEIKRIPAEHLFLGNGSDEAIDLLIRAFCEPGLNEILIPAPTYGMYQVCARINDVKVEQVLLKEDFSLDAKRMLDAVNRNTRIIFLCSPNNPTGNSFEENQVLNLLKEFEGLVVIDEAYIDFSPEDGFVKHLNEFQNLVVLQTLSKAWGLAGIRLGMAIASREIIQILDKIKYPYNVNQLTMDKALESLNRESEMKSWVKRILSQKERLAQNLNSFSFVQFVYPSDANFLLVKVDDPVGLYNHLEQNKFIVRNRSDLPLCDGCLRITTGTEIENGKLITRLQAFQKK